MCRNIKVLHHFEPPTTDEEIAAAALQYVRKVSGLAKVPAQPEAKAAFEAAVATIAAATKQMLTILPSRGEARTRAGEIERARARFARSQRGPQKSE